MIPEHKGPEQPEPPVPPLGGGVTGAGVTMKSLEFDSVPEGVGL